MLDALGIPNGIAIASGQHVVVVHVEDAARARAELLRFAGENQDRPTVEETAASLGVCLLSAAFYVVVLVAFYAAARRGVLDETAWRAGVADAAMLRAGEWWRGVTSLTLHADVLHLAGNLAFGSAFGIMLAQSVGYGAAWLRVRGDRRDRKLAQRVGAAAVAHVDRRIDRGVRRSGRAGRA